jgi:predicted nucleotidyltransferase
LASIQSELNVLVPLAIESGSRAWGFPSPDSDYDCRFIFVRRVDQLLTLWPPRDVIELPIEGDLDVNGWELGKALRLLLKGNAVVIEWLTSPIVYRAVIEFRDEMLEFARAFADPIRIQRHYLHLGASQRATYLAGSELVPLKKLFYALRPAAALRWMRVNPGARIPPMHFPTLVAEGSWPQDAAALVEELLAKKAATREMGEGAVPAPLATLINAELDETAARLALTPPSLRDGAADAANALFRAITKRMDGGA